MPTPAPTLTDAPTSPDRSDRTTFTARSIARDDFIKVTQIPELRAALANVYGNSVEAAASAVTAAAQAAVAQAAAAQAQATANATAWVSGTTYALYANVISPTDFFTYRRKVAGAGTTDPKLDSTNWSMLTLPNSSADLFAYRTFGGF